MWAGKNFAGSAVGNFSMDSTELGKRGIKD